jgi:hypothetical protein
MSIFRRLVAPRRAAVSVFTRCDENAARAWQGYCCFSAREGTRDAKLPRRSAPCNAMKSRRVAVLLFAWCVLTTTSSPALAADSESESGWWTQDSATHHEEPGAIDPATAMQMRILSVVDGYAERDRVAALSPCDLAQETERRFICWSSYGRNLHIALPRLVWKIVRPRTLYSYKSVDVRIPPSVHVRLPFKATSKLGYEDELLGWRVGLKF